MANKDNFLSDMEFDERLEAMGTDQIQLIKFVARQQYQMSKLVTIHSKKIGTLESRDKKFAGTLGGISAMVGVAIAEAFNYLIRKS